MILICVFSVLDWLQVVLDRKSSQEHPFNARVPQGFTFGLALFLLYISDLPDHVICHIAIYDDDTTLDSKGSHLSAFWQ